jgi:hypothetical protein
MISERSSGLPWLSLLDVERPTRPVDGTREVDKYRH